MNNCKIKSKDLELDFSKIIKNVSSIPPQSEVIVLVLSGALSPIHIMHVNCMEMAKIYFEKTENVPVVGGFLCPSSDGYVSSKLGAECIALAKRCHLSNLAIADSNWLCTNDSGWANAGTIIRATLKNLTTEIPNYRWRVYLVAGADHVFRHGLFSNTQEKIICIARASDTAELKEAMARSRDPNKKLILLDEGGEDISSTSVRKYILTEDWSELEPLLHKDVFEHIKAIGKNVFGKK